MVTEDWVPRCVAMATREVGVGWGSGCGLPVPSSLVGSAMVMTCSCKGQQALAGVGDNIQGFGARGSPPEGFRRGATP